MAIKIGTATLTNMWCERLVNAVQGGRAASPGSGRGRGRGRGRGWSAASRKARSGGVPTLQDLIDAGIIIPGRNNITVAYKGTTYTASLEKDGSISYQGF